MTVLHTGVAPEDMAAITRTADIVVAESFLVSWHRPFVGGVRRDSWVSQGQEFPV